MSLNSPDQNPPPSPNPTNTTSGEAPRGSYQDRLNQLTRRAAEAERTASFNAAESDEFKSKITELETKIAQLSTSRASPVNSASGDPDLSAGAGNRAQFDLGALTKAVSEEVMKGLKPVVDEFRQNREAGAVAAKQKASFDRAAQVYPDLKNPDSPVFKAFAALWDGRPDLHKVDGAPEILVEAARGLLTDARTTEQVRKMAAAANRPSAPRSMLEDSGIKDVKEAKEALGSLVGNVQREGLSSDSLEDYLRLKVATAGQSND